MALLQLLKKGRSDGSFGHGNSEIVGYRRSDGAEGICLRKGAVSLHGGGISQEGNLFPGVIRSGVGGIVAVICRDDQKIILL